MPADFYQILGLPRDASARDISSAYRKLARQFHPDVTGGDPQAEARFKEINAAHDVLSDDQKRAAYNKWGDQWEHAEQLEEMQRQHGAFRPGGFGSDGFGGGRSGNVQFDFSSLGANDLGDLGDLGDIFGGLFGDSGRRPSRTPARGRDVEHHISISLREACHGTARTLRRGANGAQLEVTIPPGIGNGQRLKFSGQGENAPSGQHGDLYLTVQVDDDPVFERRGDNLLAPVDVPLTTAALGGEVAVRSLSGSGRLALRIPAGTQNGRVFRLTGQGMPRFKREGRGDLLAAVRLRMPEPLSPAQTELFRQLRALESEREGDNA